MAERAYRRTLYLNSLIMMASKPVSAVTFGGIPDIMPESKATIRGTTFGSNTKPFWCVLSSEITAPTVTSEPVPAVVGMAYKGERVYDF